MARTELSGKQIRDGTVSLTEDVVGVLPVSKGGSGSDSLTINTVLLGNGTGALQTIGPGTSGYVLTSNGSTWISAAAAGGDVTLDGAETLTNKTISGSDNTLTDIGPSSLSATGTPDSTTFLRGDGAWAAAGGQAPHLFSGYGVSRNRAVGYGPQAFGYILDHEPWAEGQLVTFSDQTSGSDLVYFGRLFIQFAGGFGWAMNLAQILSVTGTTHDDTSSGWLMSFVAEPQVEVTANKGVAGGYPSLDASGYIPLSQWGAQSVDGGSANATPTDTLDGGTA